MDAEVETEGGKLFARITRLFNLLINSPLGEPLRHCCYQLSDLINKQLSERLGLTDRYFLLEASDQRQTNRYACVWETME